MDSRHFNNVNCYNIFISRYWVTLSKRLKPNCHMSNNKQSQDFYINWIFPVIDCLWTCRKLRQFSEKWLFWKWNYFEDESGLVSSAHWENTVHLPHILVGNVVELLDWYQKLLEFITLKGRLFKQIQHAWYLYISSCRYWVDIVDTE